MYRNICFTINNPTLNEAVELNKLVPVHAEYLIYQLEKGAHKTEHYQGYIEFISQRPIKRMSKLAALARAHLEPRMGTQKQAIDYCQKEETRIDGPWTFGTPRKQGERRDLMDLIEMVKQGVSTATMMMSHPGTMARYRKFTTDYREALLEEKAKDQYQKWKNMTTDPKPPMRHVTVLVGYTGTGKTSYVYNRYALSDIYKWSGSGGSKDSLWFDGYTGQKVLVLDDFYGQIRISLLLNMLDNYPCQLQVKGGHIWLVADEIFITSNDEPCDWYMGVSQHVKDALMRRINKIIQMK